MQGFPWFGRLTLPRAGRGLVFPLMFILGLGLLLALGQNARPALAQTPTPEAVRTVTDDDVNAVAKKLYCPVCENIPLDTCETQACEEWRQLIREKLEEGWTEQQILEYFAARYGERVLAEPRPRGVHVLFYILPPVLVLAGVGILYQVLRNWRNLPDDEASPSAAAASPPATPASEEDEYRKRLEDELRDL